MQIKYLRESKSYNDSLVYCFFAYLILVFLLNATTGHTVLDGDKAFIYGEAYRTGSIYSHILSPFNYGSPVRFLQNYAAFALSSLELNYIAKGFNQQILLSSIFLWTFVFNLDSLYKICGLKSMALALACIATFNPVSYRYLLSLNPYILSIVLISSFTVRCYLIKTNDIKCLTAGLLSLLMLIPIIGVNIPIMLAYFAFSVCIHILHKNKIVLISLLAVALMLIAYTIYSYLYNEYTTRLLQENGRFITTIFDNYIVSNIISLPTLLSQSGTNHLFGNEIFFRYASIIPILLLSFIVYSIKINKNILYLNVAFSSILFLGGTIFLPIIVIWLDKFPFLIFKSGPEKFSYIAMILLIASYAKICKNDVQSTKIRILYFLSLVYGLCIAIIAAFTIFGVFREPVNYRYSRVPVGYLEKFKNYDLYIVECAKNVLPESTSEYILISNDFPIEIRTNSLNIYLEYFKSINKIQFNEAYNVPRYSYIAVDHSCNEGNSSEFSIIVNMKIYDFYQK